jgi:hypothetical protein
MAKRLTDTDKWKDDWYISLTNDYKIVWQWLLDNCNHAGILKPSFSIMNMFCHVKLDEKKLLEIFENRVFKHENIYFIPKFIKFQYGNLNSRKPVILSVIKTLKEYNLLDKINELLNNDYIIITQSLDNDYVTIKRKRKRKSKDKSIVKSKDKCTLIELKEYIESNNLKVDAQTFYDYYDSSDWIKSNGMPVVNWKGTVRTWHNKNVKDEPEPEIYEPKMY